MSAVSLIEQSSFSLSDSEVSGSNKDNPAFGEYVEANRPTKRQKSGELPPKYIPQEYEYKTKRRRTTTRKKATTGNNITFLGCVVFSGFSMYQFVLATFQKETGKRRIYFIFALCSAIVTGILAVAFVMFTLSTQTQSDVLILLLVCVMVWIGTYFAVHSWLKKNESTMIVGIVIDSVAFIISVGYVISQINISRNLKTMIIPESPDEREQEGIIAQPREHEGQPETGDPSGSLLKKEQPPLENLGWWERRKLKEAYDSDKTQSKSSMLFQ